MNWFAAVPTPAASPEKLAPRKEKKGNQGQLTFRKPELPKETKHLLTTLDAAKYVGLAVQTLAKFRVTGESPPYFKVGRQVMYDRADLDTWLLTRRRRSTSDTGVS